MSQLSRVRILAELLAQEIAKLDGAPTPAAAPPAPAVNLTPRQPSGPIPPMPAVPPPVHPSNAGVGAAPLPVGAFGGAPL